jgi:hypothetical protein
MIGDTMSENQWRTRLGCIVAAALALRVVMVTLRVPEASQVLTPLADSGDYDALARSLLESGSFSNPAGAATAFRPPVYPLFMALVYGLFGKGNLVAVALIQAAMDAIGALLAAMLARKAGLGEKAALVAAAIHAFYPAFIVQTPQILSEVLARTMLLGTSVLLLGALEGSRWKQVAAGAALALTVLNKSVLAATVPCLVLWMVVMARGAVRERLLGAGFFVLPIVLLIGSWTARNHAVGGALIPVSTNFPITFAQGVTRFSYYTNTWHGGDMELLPAPEDFLKLTQMRSYSGIEEELRVGTQWQRDAVGFIGEHPGFFAGLTLRKALHFWGPFIRASLAERLVALVTMGAVIVGGWIWLLRSGVRGGEAARRYAWLCLAVALPVTIPYAISQPDVRYRLSLIDPLWMVMLSGLIVEGWERLKQKGSADHGSND